MRKRSRKRRKQERILYVILSVEMVCICLLGAVLWKKVSVQERAAEAVAQAEEMAMITGTVEKRPGNQEETGKESDDKAGDDKQESGTDGKKADENESKEGPENGYEELLLVNKNHKLPEDYDVTLITMPDRVNRAAEEAYKPLCNMLNAGRKEGLAFEICSSYRDVKRQEELFKEDVDALMRRGYSYLDAYEEVAKETMPPGYSEHSTGLAFDIVSLGYQMLDAKQEDTAENKWLQKHCAEFGFILRYPKDKTDITEISYESWHFRYVGVDAAQYIMENDLTLEEYLEEAEKQLS